MGILSAIFGDDTPEEMIGEAKDKIREVVETLAQDERIDEWEETGGGFAIEKGSAHIRVEFVGNESVPPQILFVSPIVRLPSSNLLAFYRRLLEINSEWRGLMSIGVDGAVVQVGLGRPIEGLAESEMSDALKHVCNAADALDDELREQFGAPLWERND